MTDGLDDFSLFSNNLTNHFGGSGNFQGNKISGFSALDTKTIGAGDDRLKDVF